MGDEELIFNRVALLIPLNSKCLSIIGDDSRIFDTVKGVTELD